MNAAALEDSRGYKTRGFGITIIRAREEDFCRFLLFLTPDTSYLIPERGDIIEIL
jgi:hypothetical protein